MHIFRPFHSELAVDTCTDTVSNTRMRAVLRGCDRRDIILVDNTDAREHLLRVHTATYLDRIDTLMRQIVGTSEIYSVGKHSDVSVCANSNLVAYEGIMCVIAAVECNQHAFCALPMPGHHAYADYGSGFCLYNNVMVGVRYLQSLRPCKVAIVDWDVHHGDGTHSLLHDDSVLFISLYQLNIFPQSAQRAVPGNNIHHFPYNAHTGSAAYIERFEEYALPLLQEYQPEVVFISCGFDAHHLDAYAQTNLEAADFGVLTRYLVQLPSTPRIISVLEGGYDIVALEECTRCHLQALTSTL